MSSPTSRRLRLAPAVTFHARGSTCFAWHGDTGDVCEMSRDVVALMTACAHPRGATPAEARSRAAFTDETRASSFLDVLARRGFLLAAGASLDLAVRRPFVSRFTVYERQGPDVMVHARDLSIRVAGGAALMAAAEEGMRPLGELVPRRRFAEIARLCRADVAALKLLPPGDDLPRWAESTMPWPAVDGAALAAGSLPPAGTPVARPDDLAGYHRSIDDPERQFDETETTLSHLFREPHRALGGERFGDRLAAALITRGVPARGARVIEVGGGLGWLAVALRERLAPSSYLIVDRSPALARAQRTRGLLSVVGDARRLPVGDGAVDLLVSNEMAGDLPGEEAGDLAGDGALRLIDECARVLAPGGVAWVSEFGHPSAPPVVSDHLDHDERSIRFNDLRRRASALGLEASVVPVPAVIGLDPDPLALATTRASFAALRRLFASRGVALAKRAWLLDEIEAVARQAGLDPGALHGLVASPIGERTMGLKPREFWALIARRPRRPDSSRPAGE